MHQIPDHVPVISVSGIEQSKIRELYGRLRASLEAAAIRINRVDRLDDPPSPISLIRSLGSADLLFVESRAEEVGACLEFTEPEAFRAGTTGGTREHQFYCAGESDVPSCSERILSWLDGQPGRTPLYGAVLIGGKSSRMGKPKHLIRDRRGKSWLEILVEKIEPFVDELVVSGLGEMPELLEKRIARIDDLPGLQGPLAGIGALLNTHPYTSWLVTACDMPQINEQSLVWLLGQRRRNCAAVLPRNPESGRSEPLLAYYDYRCGPLLEDLIRSGSRKIRELAGEDMVLQPEIPVDLLGCWQNVNYPEEVPRDPSGF